jgi:hypothetical protein
VNYAEGVQAAASVTGGFWVGRGQKLAKRRARIAVTFCSAICTFLRVGTFYCGRLRGTAQALDDLGPAESVVPANADRH